MNGGFLRVVLLKQGLGRFGRNFGGIHFYIMWIVVERLAIRKEPYTIHNNSRGAPLTGLAVWLMWGGFAAPFILEDEHLNKILLLFRFARLASQAASCCFQSGKRKILYFLVYELFFIIFPSSRVILLTLNVKPFNDNSRDLMDTYFM